MKKTMRYMAVTRLGGPEVLQLAEKPIPEPGPGEVLIRVCAAGVNRADLGQRAGLYPGQGDQMPLLGLEVSGEIAEVGVGVTAFQPGDAVCALVNGGGYAQYVLAPAGQCLPIPDGITMLAAAAIPEAAMTVWSNIFAEDPPQAGAFFLVHGGSSGIGTFAIQLGAALGLRVLTTIGSEEKCRRVRELGAELAINYREEAFAPRVQQHVGSQGVQAILDMVGGDYTEQNIRLLGLDGKLAQIAFQQGAKVQINLMEVMMRRARISGSMLTRRSVQEKAAFAADLLQHVWPLYQRGAIRVPIQQIVPLSAAAQVHQMMHSGGHRGKFILQVQDEPSPVASR
ncbi:MAG: NAD(P)H-quinone oxidoreductase [Enterobacteriaceae bacterium]